MFEKVHSTLKIVRIENNFLMILYKANIIQFFIIVILSLCLVSLFPLKEKVPYLVQFSNAQMNFVKIRKAGEGLTEDKQVRLSLVMAYVLNREVKNNIDDQTRHNVVRLQSSGSVWKQFKTIVNDKRSIYKKENVLRNIDILNFYIVPETNIAQIDFRSTTLRNAKKISSKNYRAVIEFEFVEKKISVQDMALNPTSFNVINYQVSKVD